MNEPLTGAIFIDIRRFRTLVRRIAPDHLVTYHWGVIDWVLANSPQSTPHFHIEDGFDGDETSWRGTVCAWLRRIALRGKEVLVPSISLQKLAIQNWKLAPGWVHRVPNSIDAARYAREPDPVQLADFGDPAKGPLIGTICELVEEKRIDRLIDAFAKLIDNGHLARRAIVGDGPERDEL